MWKFFTDLFAGLAALFGKSENPLVTQVRDKTAIICSFVPTVETVTSLLAVHPGITSAMSIAKMICEAISKKSGVTDDGCVAIIDGVCIRGEWIK